MGMGMGLYVAGMDTSAANGDARIPGLRWSTSSSTSQDRIFGIIRGSQRTK